MELNISNDGLAVIGANIALIAIMIGTVVSIWIHQSSQFNEVNKKFDKVHEEIMNMKIDINKIGVK